MLQAGGTNPKYRAAVLTTASHSKGLAQDWKIAERKWAYSVKGARAMKDTERG